MMIPINLNDAQYDIIIEKNCLQRASEEINLRRNILLVTDDGVPVEYVDSIANQCKNPVIAVIPQGEQSKSLAQFERLMKVLIKYRFQRDDAVIAIGGGVVGDLAGFVAACYMRGIDFYNIPTTLLAQIDSSIGGKTAIDIANLKNICGAFYQPKKVLIDPTVLESLEDRQKRSGLVEAIKMAATSNAGLFSILENEAAFEKIETIIEQSLLIKAAVVEKDEKESSLRKVLNFGHTVGHAIEVQSDYLHGECVGIGMLYFCSDKVRAEIKAVLEKYHLPTDTNLSVEQLWQALIHDKKAAADHLTVVYVPEIGSFELRNMTFPELKNYLQQQEAKIKNKIEIIN